MTYTQAVIIFVAIPVAFGIAQLLVGAVTPPVRPTSRVKPSGSRRGRGSLQGTAPAISQSSTAGPRRLTASARGGVLAQSTPTVNGGHPAVRGVPASRNVG